MDVLIAGPPVAGGGEFQRAAAAFHRNDVLHGAFSEAAFSDDDRAAVVLEASGEDFAGARRVVIDEHGERDVARQDEIGPGRVPAGFRAVASPRADDDAAVEQHVGGLDGGGEQTASVVPQIDDHGFRPLAPSVRRIQGGSQFFRRAFAERHDAHQGDSGMLGEKKIPTAVGAAGVAKDRIGLDFIAHHGDIERSVDTRSAERQCHRRADRAVDPFHDFAERTVVERLAVDRRD